MMDIEALWDYNSPEISEERFRQALAQESNPGVIGELTSQIARTYSMRRRFDEAHALLDEVERSSESRVRVRYLLERGRTLNSSQHQDLARPLFLEAHEIASECSEEFLAADAAHMVAIASEGETAIEWNLRTMETARRSSDPRAKKWIASAGNNLGWSYHVLGRFPEALEQFEAALEARQGGPIENILIARWCIARTWRSLGLYEEALTEQHELEAERERLGLPRGFVFEEIAECLLALGRNEEARPYFARAHEQLSQDQWLTADEPERLERLVRLSR
jgi:tetratricopeptide (TPR) repeat protein